MYELKQRFKAYRGIMRQIRDLEQDLEKAEYDHTGVKGVRFDKIGGTTNERQKQQIRLKQMEHIDSLRKEIDSLRKTLDDMDGMIAQMEEETGTAVRQIYIHGRRYVDVARELYISKSGLEKRINKEIEKVEKGMHPPNL